VKRRHLITVGLTVLVAVFLLVRAIIFLHPSPGDGKQKLRVRFESVEKIAPGTRVAFAGKPVGEVSSVTLLSDVIDRSRQSAQIFPYEAILSIDSSVKVYKTDEISVKTSGLMGERFIVITPKQFPSGTEGELVLPTNILYAQPVGSAEQAIQEISSVAQKADETMDALTTLIKGNQENIVLATKSFMEATNSLNYILTGLAENNFSDKISTFTNKANSCTEQIELLVKKINKSVDDGGTLGRFIQDPQLYNSTVICLDGASQLISDIDNYGVFFHTNRDWQRENALRKDLSTIDKNSTLRTKVRQKFANVSNALVDISTSVEQASKNLDHKDFSQDETFKNEFIQQVNEIQKRLDTLHDAIENLEIGSTETGDKKS
jgi:phospholipid/cholesterol/gamma-HCH transport system substrate-binding protein